MSEVRLIDANDLRKKAYPFPCAIGVELAVPIRAIDDALTIDAVEVVRCKDCQLRYTDDCINWGVDDDEYCSWGERKEKTMTRLIDADALKRQFRVNSDALQRVICAEIDAAPTIDTVRHAHWEAVEVCCNHAKDFRCSGDDGCGGGIDYGYYTRICDYEYCPWCGARMDAEEET